MPKKQTITCLLIVLLGIHHLCAQTTRAFVPGQRSYESAGAMGNVGQVLTGKKLIRGANAATRYYGPSITLHSDYYPFGMQQNQRFGAERGYRFAFQGMESEAEWRGAGNSYTTLFRQYDPRLGRWLSRDPRTAELPWESPYAAMHNNPIAFSDQLGDCPKCDEARQAVNAISADLTDAWNNSGNNTSKEREWAGAIVKRTIDGKSTVKAVNVKEYGKAHSRPKTKGGEIEKDTDEVIGEFHTHPYDPNDIARTVNGYNWDGQGAGPSGGDIASLAADKKVKDGYFMVIESGNARYLIVVTDKKALMELMGESSGNNGAPVVVQSDAETVIDTEIGNATIDINNYEKNPNATSPGTYPEAMEKGFKKGIETLLKRDNLSDPGFMMQKSTFDTKTGTWSTFTDVL